MNELTIIQRGGFYGLYNNRHEEEVVECQYNQIRETGFGYYIVIKGNNAGILDNEGEFVYPLSQSRINIIHENLFRIKQEDSNRYIFFDRFVTTNINVDKITFIEDRNIFVVRKNGKYALMNLRFHIISDLYDEIQKLLTLDCFAYKINEQWGLLKIRKNKSIVISEAKYADYKTLKQNHHVIYLQYKESQKSLNPTY